MAPDGLFAAIPTLPAVVNVMTLPAVKLPIDAFVAPAASRLI